MFGYSPFYNQIIRKHIIVFSTLFNQILITRDDNNGTEQKRFVVPIEYGPHQKWLARLQADSELNRPESIFLPRMSYEITNVQYDPQRKRSRLANCTLPGSDNTTRGAIYSPVPYNFDFSLSILSKYSEDGFKIVEQIMPFFTPEWNSTVELVSGVKYDIPTILNSVQNEDVYEGTFQERQVYLWTLQFTMKGYFLGPTSNKKVIKFANVNMHSTLTATNPDSRILVYPGLTANGSPADFIESQVYNASANAVISSNSVSDIQVSNTGLGYSTATITISDPDVGSNTATAEAVIQADRIQDITITNPGQGYTSTPAVTISDPDNVSVAANTITKEDNWDYIVIIEDA